LNKFLHTYTGHFHKFQQGTNYTYIGALVRNDFGEWENPTQYLYLELGASKILKQEFREIADNPWQQYEREVNSEQEIIDFINSLTMEDAIVKIKFKLNADFTIQRRKLKELARRQHPLEILIEYEREDSLVKESLEQDLDYWQAFNKFVQLKNLTKTQIEVGKAIIKEIYEE